MVKEKKCEVCGKDFAPSYKVTKRYWAGRRFCSDECKFVGMKGEGRSTKGVERTSLDEKFWSKVEKGAKSECWLWLGAIDLRGYGFLKDLNGKDIKAHRLSYQLNNGEIPKGLCVCHSCDTPQCVNPNHLWLGTRKDNNADRSKKGRGRENRQSGANNARSKITDEQKNKIIQLVKQGLSQQKAGEAFGIKQAQVSKIINGVSWKSNTKE